MAKGKFKSKKEFVKIMDELFTVMSTDPKMGPKLAVARVPQRWEFTDYDLVLNVTYADSKTAKKGQFLKCAECEEEARRLVDANVRTIQGIDCAQLKHTHECGCHLGHDCQVGCAIHDEAEKYIAGEDNPPPLVVLAKEGPSDVMLGVFTRLSHLEEENADLKRLLARLIEALPEEFCEASGCAEVLSGTKSQPSR